MKKIKHGLSFLLCLALMVAFSATTYAHEVPIVKVPTEFSQSEAIYLGELNLNSRTAINTTIPSYSHVYFTINAPSIYDLEIALNSTSNPCAIEIFDSEYGQQFLKTFYSHSVYHTESFGFYRGGTVTVFLSNESAYDTFFSGTINLPPH